VGALAIILLNAFGTWACVRVLTQFGSSFSYDITENEITTGPVILHSYSTVTLYAHPPTDRDGMIFVAAESSKLPPP